MSEKSILIGALNLAAGPLDQAGDHEKAAGLRLAIEYIKVILSPHDTELTVNVEPVPISHTCHECGRDVTWAQVTADRLEEEQAIEDLGPWAWKDDSHYAQFLCKVQAGKSYPHHVVR